MNTLVTKATDDFTVTMLALITKSGCWCYAKRTRMLQSGDIFRARFEFLKAFVEGIVLLAYYILYVFFWVFPLRPIVVCRRFGTLYQFHLQGLDIEYEVIEGSETSANKNRTLGKYPKEYIQDSKHGESLKSKILHFDC